MSAVCRLFFCGNASCRAKCRECVSEQTRACGFHNISTVRVVHTEPGEFLMKLRLIPIAAVAALVLAGCEKSPTEVSKAVDKARDSASVSVDAARKDAGMAEDKADEKVANAQQDYAETDASARKELSVVEAEAMVKKANAEFDVANAEAEGRHGVAIQKCEMFAGAEKDACMSSADATLATDKAAAIARRDAALVQAERHE